ncbi:PepSY domain-containing protein [Dyadobacter luteus]|uniref:PepSY domain-containing protein n=1 Tax=Dyadobacter luteus TaxID=2259619 RepID=A0A3D8YHR7_9BACT|nr:PepSY-associated TM helix domain-containing protein [Dyadobacter luteus]REA64332.1 PepSY domain-containing protein [Dyadobacter luteus]
MNVKKLTGKIHLWLGLVSGIIVFILGITGCIYVFIDEIKPLLYADKYFIQSPGRKGLPLSQTLQAAQDSYGADKPVSAVEIYNSEDRSLRFRAYKESGDPGIWYWDRKEYYESIFINPYSGQVIATENSEFEFFRIILYLHWSLLLSNEIGQPITGIATLIFVISLVTGLILWKPKNKSAARQRYWFRWKSTTKWRRKNYDLHNIPGFYSMAFMLIIGLTGMVFAFSWFDASVQWIANAGKSYPAKAPVFSDTSQSKIDLPIDVVFSSVRRKHPHAEGYHIYFPVSRQGVFNVLVRNGQTYNQVIEQYDQYTGKLLKTHYFTDKNPGEKLRGLNYEIHTGSILGLPGKILAFFASLIAASLPVSGLLIWRGRRKSAPKTLY